jgi:fluoroacetyl-CoA thioesterase
MTRLLPGLRHTGSLHARPGGGPDATLATAFLAGFAEWNCVEALRSALPENETSLGTLLYLNHNAAAMPEDTLTVTAELVAVDGVRLRFRIDCFAGEQRIGAGFHERRLTGAKRLADAA